jgi:hypothetical protein
MFLRPLPRCRRSLLLTSVVGDLPPARQSLIARTLAKRKQIEAANLTVLEDPMFKEPIPHPSINCNLSSDRFKDYTPKEGAFTYMGRVALTKLLDGIRNSHSSEINVLGTKQYGKSHMLAAYVAQRMQDCFSPTKAADRTTRPVIFLPKCSEFAKSPENYLHQAMMLGFAAVEGALEEIARLAEGDLLAWLQSKVFDVVADQANDLDPNEKLLRISDESKSRASRLLVQLGIICGGHSCFILRGFSANNEIMKTLESTEDVAHKIQFYGGFSEVCPISSLVLFGWLLQVLRVSALP